MRWIVTVLLLLTAAVCAADNPAVTPEARPDDWWQTRHQQMCERVRRQQFDLILVGDSITQNYERPEWRPVWDRYYARRRALNLGFSGDTTANVLWRLQNGEVAGLHPRVAVVLIGTNNSGIYHGWTAEQTKPGMDAVVLELHQRLPDTAIVLLGILPTGLSPEKQATDREVNRYLSEHYRNSSFVTYLDISTHFMKDGIVNSDLFADSRHTPPQPALHPNEEGQALMAAAIDPTISRLLPDSKP